MTYRPQFVRISVGRSDTSDKNLIVFLLVRTPLGIRISLMAEW